MASAVGGRSRGAAHSPGPGQASGCFPGCSCQRRPRPGRGQAAATLFQVHLCPLPASPPPSPVGPFPSPRSPPVRPQEPMWYLQARRVLCLPSHCGSGEQPRWGREVYPHRHSFLGTQVLALRAPSTSSGLKVPVPAARGVHPHGFVLASVPGTGLGTQARAADSGSLPCVRSLSFPCSVWDTEADP